MIELSTDPVAFDVRAGEFVRERIESTVLATVLQGLLDSGREAEPARFAVVADPGTGAVTGAALQLPPFPLVCTELAAGEATALAGRWLASFDSAPVRVNGPPRGAREIAAHWARALRRTDRVRTALALHVLERVQPPPRPAPGHLRAVRDDELELIVEWERAFVADAGITETDRVVELARRRVAERRAWLWEDEGTRVSVVGHSPTVAGTARVGPVYTPPAHRAHGYASSAVAACSRRLLAAGAQRVVLYTDLSNPTSNRIYADVGYRRIADFEEHELA